ncbi:hypothetical protein [Pelagibaculum spongiae]|uniref:Transposase n=1 Tax=Pelagibaculum spongiae TaxID=2080658 RepID=A0A2V1H5A6_9GAMM|nr:hypothetical protein [Pelagibaculum spongiae]PVZ72438.1 hypothetical protein DC094_05385 [Pelagibaculum spongiae]
MTGHHFNSAKPHSDQTFDFGRRYTDTVEIAKVGPRRVGMNPQFCHWFHCMSRVCRKAWLCGVDPDTGESFEHRRDWIVKRLALLKTKPARHKLIDETPLRINSFNFTAGFLFYMLPKLQ